MSEKDNLVSRRGFLKKTALLGAGLAATGSMVACALAGGTSETIKWDKEVDVVVVGSGTVAIAAIAAKDAGAESDYFWRRVQLLAGLPLFQEAVFGFQ